MGLIIRVLATIIVSLLMHVSCAAAQDQKLPAEPGERVPQLECSTSEPNAFPVSRNLMTAFVDKSGKFITEFRYDRSGAFSEGLAPVAIDDNYTPKWGYIDRHGNLSIPLQFDTAGEFSEGLAPVSLRGKAGFVDKTGKIVIPLQFQEASWFCDGLAAVRSNGKVGYIDKNANMIIPAQFDEGEQFSEGVAQVMLGGTAYKFNIHPFTGFSLWGLVQAST